MILRRAEHFVDDSQKDPVYVGGKLTVKQAVYEYASATRTDLQHGWLVVCAEEGDVAIFPPEVVECVEYHNTSKEKK